MFTLSQMYNSSGYAIEQLYEASILRRRANGWHGYEIDPVDAQVEWERACDVYFEAEQLFGEIFDQAEHDFYEWLSEADLRRAERGYL